MLRARRSVVVVALAVELRRALREASGAVRNHRHELHGLATGFTGASLRRVSQTLHALFVRDRSHALAACFAEVEGADGRDRLHPQLGLRLTERVAAAGTDAQRTDALAIDLRMLRKEIDRAADVIEALRRHFHQPRLAA